MYDELILLNTGDYDIVELLELMLLLVIVILINVYIWYMMLYHDVENNIGDGVVTRNRVYIWLMVKTAPRHDEECNRQLDG